MFPVPRLRAVVAVGAATALLTATPPTFAGPTAHPSAVEHAHDRVMEARVDRTEEPADAWSGPSEPDTSGAGDTPAGIRQTPTSPRHGAVPPEDRKA